MGAPALHTNKHSHTYIHRRTCVSVCVYFRLAFCAHQKFLRSLQQEITLLVVSLSLLTYTCYNHHIRRPSFTVPGGSLAFNTKAHFAMCVCVKRNKRKRRRTSYSFVTDKVVQQTKTTITKSCWCFLLLLLQALKTGYRNLLLKKIKN